MTDHTAALREQVLKAINRAWHLGQTYWQQADSDSYIQHRKSDDTLAKFRALVDEAATLLSAQPQQPAGWRPIETCPRHKDVLFYREDAGVFYGQYTYCAEWVSEEEQERAQYDEETLWSESCWAFDHSGCDRLDGDMKPTHWMPLPPEPTAHPSQQEDDALDAALRERVRDAIAIALGDAYDCLRVWSAWSVGTMGPDDFSLIAEDDERLDEITDAAIAAMTAAQRDAVQGGGNA